ncbi:aminoglycoside phosphotransferase family protein [Consotaella aegiceratis]|uniref:aminoglycoside phosphotransferase family protein n=1 Tax=Consotaella aegiceratis TaxID=3097961 RepID=UPI002F427AFB
MTVFPTIEDGSAFKSWRSDRDLWLPLVREIVRVEKLPATMFAAYGTGTNLVVDLGGGRVLKVFPPIHRSQFISERATLRVLEGQLSLAIPTIVADGERDGWSYLVITRLAGVLGSQAWPQLPEADKERVLAEIGRAIAEVQSVPPGDLASIEPDWPTFIARQIAGCKERHARQGLAPRLLSDLDALLAEASSIVPMDAPPVILTGEWIPENFLLAEDDGHWRLAGLIDFGDVMTGWREYDLLGPSAFMCAGRPKRVRRLLEGYGVPPRDADPTMRRRLLTLMLLHRASDLRNVDIEGWEDRIGRLTDLEELIWPFEEQD